MAQLQPIQMLPGQTLLDVAIERYGSPEGMVLLMHDNPSVMAAEMYGAGQLLNIRPIRSEWEWDGVQVGNPSLADRTRALNAGKVATESAFPVIPPCLYLSSASFGDPRVITDAETGELLLIEVGEGRDGLVASYVSIADVFVGGVGPGAAISGTPILEAVDDPSGLTSFQLVDANGPTFLSAGVYELVFTASVTLSGGGTCVYSYRKTFSV